MTMTRILFLLLASIGVLAAQPVPSTPPVPPVPKPLPALELPAPVSSPARSRDISAQRLLKVRRIGGLSISPDGQWAAFTLRQPDLKFNGYRTALFVTATSGRQQPLNLGSVGPGIFTEYHHPLTIDPVWSQDSRYILYPMPEVGSSGEFGKSQLFRWSRDGGPPTQLTHSTTGVLYAVRTSDGRIFYSTLGKRPDLETLANKYFDHGIWYFDLDSATDSVGSISPAFTRRGPDVLDQVLHHMRTLYEPATYQWLDDAPYEVHVLDDPSRKERDVTTEEAKLYRKLAESHSIVSDWETSLDDPTRVWIPGPTGAEICFQEKAHNGRDDPSAPSNLKGHKLIYSVSRDGSKVRQVSPSSDYSYSDCSYSTSAKRFACVRENPTNPPEIVVFNSDASGEQVLTDLNPEVQTWKLPEVELAEWIDSKGNPGFGYLYKPVGFGQGPYPTIVLPYATATYDFTETVVVSNEYPTYAFTSRGYAVLRPDMRFYTVPNASGPSKKLWMNEGSLASILSGLDHLIDTGVADRARVGIAGLSQGAKYASYAIAHSHAFAAASVPITAPSPLNSGGAYYAASQGNRDMNNHDDEGRVVNGLVRARAEESQVSDWADTVVTPLLIDASDGEWVWSVQAAIALRTRGKPVEMVIYPDARHFKKWPRQIESVWEMNLDWFDFWLRDSRDPVPEKREQYQRWEKLKTTRAHTGQAPIY
jgi:dipeptidyl aminopeptidase/acylaminoacyl peptidase